MRSRRDFMKLTAGGLALTGTRAFATQGLYVPPEEGPHELTFMQWPNSRAVYDDRWWLADVQGTIARIANAIADFEPVVMLADKSRHRAARKLLSDQVELWDIPTEDLWARDSGPLTAFRGNQRVVSHIQFNGWGGKQRDRQDARVAERAAEALGFDLVPSGIVGECGGVEHDGHGLLMAHESSWVNRNRNPGLSRQEIENGLLDAYGADRMIWAEGVYGEDITDYHIDSLARFTGAGRVLVNMPQEVDPADPFHLAAEETLAAIRSAGLKVEVIPEPIRRRVEALDFVASYANYYACNGAVIMAQFGDRAADKEAAKAMARHYPEREIVALNVDALGEIGGGIHCATQQLPAA
ncbi:agmatine deiminase family protein [Cognatishimia sp.]|uniref:agmatine deiminase family protein n=1 Tax=Cognatishimia sp. TaxID=2211648 RepID=UPI0035112556|nr:agmatine deiminase family protein [Cognatishimia sp.]